MNARRHASVLTHATPEQTADALTELVAAAQRAGVTLVFDTEEAEKHALSSGEGVVIVAPEDPLSSDVEVCIVLGGDGTILRGLRRYAGTSVPVFAVNYGEVGFLATVEPRDDLPGAFDRAFSGEFDVLSLPALAVELPDGINVAFNDVAIHRQVGKRVARLAYALHDHEVGSVRCDGLVVATPAGSTGYNLANGGPVLAWGVEGFAVSFIAPHSLTARGLVCAPEDVLRIDNQSQDAVDVAIDGRPAGLIEPRESVMVRFMREAADLAQVSGSSFYLRLREKFGLLA